MSTVHRVVAASRRARRAALQVVDRLEQRDDVELRGGAADPSGAGDQPDLLEQHRHFEHVAHVVGHRDHVVRHDPPADAARPHRQRLRGSPAPTACARRRSAPGWRSSRGRAQLAVSTRHARPARRASCSRRRPRRSREQLGEHLLVDGRVLAQVEPAQVGAEDRDAAADRARPARRRSTPAPWPCSESITVSRSTTSSVEVGVRGAGRPIGAGPGTSTPAVEHRRRERVQTGVHAAERSPVRLVGSERRLVARAGGEREQRRRSA